MLMVASNLPVSANFVTYRRAVASTVDVVSHCSSKLQRHSAVLARAKLRMEAGRRPVSAVRERHTMKKSLLTKIAALAITLAFPLGAFAAPAAKMTTDGSVSKKGQTHRKHYFAKPWLDS